MLSLKVGECTPWRWEVLSLEVWGALPGGGGCSPWRCGVISLEVGGALPGELV